MKSYEEELQGTFRECKPVAARLVLSRIPRRDRHLREMVHYALDRQTQSEYPFVFRYAFCRRPSDAPRTTRLAAAVHLLQSSIFITDDIFDGSDRRYHQEALHTRYGISYAIVAVELLQGVAQEVFSEGAGRRGAAHSKAAQGTLQRILTDVYLGQYIDIFQTGQPRVSVADYRRVIKGGMGLFVGNLARFAALLAGKSNGEVAALFEFGYHYGMAVMISDDVLDLLQTQDRTGKEFAADLKGRRLRLPVLLALRMAPPSARRRIRSFLVGRSSPPPLLKGVVHDIRDSGALEECTAIARSHIARAKRSLAKAADGVCRGALTWLAGSLLREQKLE